MKTNLIFKRQEVIDGVTRVVTKIVPVDVPFLKSGEGWILSGHTDIVEVIDDLPVPECDQVSFNFENNILDSKTAEVTRFESDVKGTAKLVRSKGVIKIVSRRGKTTYNQTTPNSVCINDFTKNEFFKNCRETHGNGSGIFEFRISDGKPYDYWNTIIDKEYARQKEKYVNKCNS